MNNPDSASAQLGLINASQSMIAVCHHLHHHIVITCAITYTSQLERW